MQARWYIQKDGRAIGPMTAAEIRDGLRDGSYDPFDLVTREGRTEKIELVEVDEIFVSNRSDHDKKPDVSTSVPSLSIFGAEDEQRNAFESKGPVSSGSQQSKEGPRTSNIHSELADKSVEKDLYGQADPAQSLPPYQAAKPRQRREPKAYYIVNKSGRVLGPISARVILSLYYKGVVDKSVIVVKNGSRNRVKIEKFVAVYSKMRGDHRPISGVGRSEVAEVGGGGLAQDGRFDTKKVLAATFLEREKLTHIAYALAGFLLFLAIAIVLMSPNHNLLARLRSTVQQINLFEKDSGEERRPQSLRGRVSPRPNPEASRKPGLQDDQLPGQAPTRRPAGRIQASRSRQIQQNNKPVGTKAGITPSPLAGRQNNDRIRAQTRQKQRVDAQKKLLLERRRRDEQRRRRERIEARRKQMAEAQARLRAKPTLSPQSTVQATSLRPAARAAAPAGVSVASLVDGQQVTGLGPMSFNPSEVAGCDSACSVTFLGPSGRVRGKFFKSVWGPILQNKSGSVYLTGMIRKSGGSTTIILSNIQ